MGIVNVREVSSGRTGSVDNSLDRSYVRVFEVDVDTLLDGPEIIFASGVLPPLYAPYTPASGTADFGSWCQSRKTEVLPNAKVWKITCSYSTKLDRPDLNTQVSPELRPAEIDWDTITIAVPALVDINGLPILNSAGDLFDPPIEEEETRLLLRISKNIVDDPSTPTGFDANAFGQYQNKVNSNKWLGFKKFQVKCRKMKSTRFFEDARYFWRLSGEFEISFRTPPANVVWPNGFQIDADDSTSLAWIKYVLDRGFREIKQIPLAMAGKRAAVLDPQTKMPVSVPALLDGTGKALAAGLQPVFLAYNIIPTANFSLIGLP